MAVTELSDAEVFGSPQKELTDAEVFGKSSQPKELSDQDVGLAPISKPSAIEKPSSVMSFGELAGAHKELGAALASKLGMSTNTVSDALDELQASGLRASASATGMPPQQAKQAQEAAQKVELQPTKPGTASKAIAGGLNAINAQTAYTVTSPLALAAMATGARPVAALLGNAGPLINRVLSLGFASQALAQTPQVAKNLIDAVGSKDPYNIAQSSADAAMTIMFGAAGAKYGLKGIARDVPILNDALTKTVKDNYTPEQLKDIYTRVSIGQGTPQEQDLVKFINSESGKPAQVVKAGAEVTTTTPRIDYEPLNKFLGVDASKILTVTGEPTTEQGGQNAVRKPSTGSLLQYPQEGVGTEGGERGRVEPGQQGEEAAPVQPEVPVEEQTPRPVNAGEVETQTPITPHDLQPALLVNGTPVTSPASLVHRDIVDEAVKAGAENAPDLIESAGKDENHVFVDKTGKVYDRTQAATALGLKGKLHSEQLNELRGPSPDWQVTVQPKEGDVPGYVQIDKIENGQNIWSASPETLTKKGYKIPDLSGLPKGKYSFAQAQQMLQTAHSEDLVKAKEPFQPDDQLIMHSPYTNDDAIVSYRGPLGSDKSVVWTGKIQMAIPTSWLRRQGEKYEGQIQPVAPIPSVAKVATPLPPATGVRAEVQPVTRVATTDPRLMTDEQLQVELKSLDDAATPLHEEFLKIPEDLLLTRRGTSTPRAKAIEDNLKPIYDRKQSIQFEIKRRADEAKNKAMFTARDKRVAEAPVFQNRNGWEIVKDGVDYVLRDPYTKEDVYRGKLSRCREVADESALTPPPKTPEVSSKLVVESAPLKPSDIGYRTAKAFQRDFAKNSLKDLKETPEEFMMRRHCSETVPKRGKALAE